MSISEWRTQACGDPWWDDGRLSEILVRRQRQRHPAHQRQSDVTLTYDAENRLTAMSGGVTASYVYDGDGNRVKETISGVRRSSWATPTKWTTARSRSISTPATRVAMRTGDSTINYLLGDHLGSTALTLNSAGNRTPTEFALLSLGALALQSGQSGTTYRFHRSTLG
ncbi:MAG: hypothetical protein IPM84_21465 [Anaerolineae bacterium]|nr:hypothetical protein [Anaerolineae bacterium]